MKQFKRYEIQVKMLSLLVSAVLILSACSSAEEVKPIEKDAAAEIPTQAEPVTETPLPQASYTSTPIPSSTDTVEPSPTVTPAPSLTPTPEPSPTSMWQAGETLKWEKDGMNLVYVPAGAFEMGLEQGFDDEKPVHTVFLDGFWIDQTEVTNGMYAQCVAAGICEAPRFFDSHSTYGGAYYDNPTYNQHPVIYVNWFDARTYCEWAGRRMPTEAEWEKAARGTDGRMYPWGNDAPDSSLGNFLHNLDDTVKVGSYPAGASPYGALDMAGNVFEWVADYYAEDYYSWSPESNPAGPDSGDLRITRGGDFINNASFGRSTYRFSRTPILSWFGAGFRCAVSPNVVVAWLDAGDAPIKTPTPEPAADISIGDTIVSETDGMTLVAVPAGEFVMGSGRTHISDVVEDCMRRGGGCDLQDYLDEYPRHFVYLDSYYIDRTEVTNAMYARCVEAGACDPPAAVYSNTRSEYYGAASFADYPVILVDWFQAEAYCAWAGRRLPTEAEWEKAARGTDEAFYPWGNQGAAGHLLNFADVNVLFPLAWADPNANDGYADTAPVSSYPSGASPYGALGMAGNVGEWVEDWYAEDYYESYPSDNPLGPESGSMRVWKGGSWTQVGVDARGAFRDGAKPGTAWDLLGFRCALTP